MTANPYQTIDFEGDDHPDSGGDWLVLPDGLLEGGTRIVLPRICHATQQTENLLPFDIKLIHQPPRVAYTWVALFTIHFGSRFIPRTPVPGALSAVLTLGLVVFGLCSGKAIRLRVFESHVTRSSRRKALFRSRLLNGAMFVGVIVVFLVMIESTAPGWVMLTIILAIVVIWFVVGQLIDQTTTPKLNVSKSGSGTYLIEGLNPKFQAALSAFRAESWDA